MTSETRKGIISFSITDRGALYSCYMPYVSNGGVFVPTPRQYELGDRVFMLLKFMDDTQHSTVEGTVVWVTPPGAQGSKTPGIGVQFSDDGNAMRSRLEEQLAGALQGERPTQTM